MYKQLFFLLQLATGLLLTGCLVTAQENDISSYEDNQVQLQRFMDALSKLTQQNNKRLNRIDSTLRSLEGSVGTCFKTSKAKDCSATQPTYNELQTLTGSPKDIADRLKEFESFISSRGESTKHDMEEKESALNDLSTKVQQLTNAAQAIVKLLERHDSVIKSLEKSLENSIKKSHEREDNLTHQTDAKIEGLAKSTQEILNVLSNLKPPTKRQDDNETPSTESDKKKKVFTVVVKKKLTWFEAVTDCKARGLRLATIENEEEQQQVFDLINDQVGLEVDGSFWLYGSDKAQTGHWVWTTTGQPLNYTAWYEGQPDNYNHGGGQVEHCLTVRGDKDHMWNDMVCEWRYFYICDNQN